MFCLKRGNFIHSFAWEFFLCWVEGSKFRASLGEKRISFYFFYHLISCKDLKDSPDVWSSWNSFSGRCFEPVVYFVCSLQTWPWFDSFSPRVRNCPHKSLADQQISRNLEPHLKMDSTVLDTARKSSKTCQIEGCHETTVGSRTALCRKHRNNRYKQNYKKKKRRAQGSDVSSPKGFKYFKSYQLCNVQSLRFQQKHYFSVRYKLLPRHKSHVFVKLIFPLFISHCFYTDFNSMVYLTGFASKAH